MPAHLQHRQPGRLGAGYGKISAANAFSVTFRRSLAGQSYTETLRYFARHRIIIADRISTGANAIASVRLSVRLFLL